MTSYLMWPNQVCFIYLHFFFSYPYSVFIPIVRHNRFISVYHCGYYHHKVTSRCHDFVFIVIFRCLWTFCFGHQLWSFLISCVFQSVFIRLFGVPKDTLFRSMLGILTLSLFLFLWPLIVCLVSNWHLLERLPGNVTQSNIRIQTRCNIPKRFDDCWPEHFCEDALTLFQAI